MCSRTARRPLRRWRRCLGRCKSEAPSSKATPQLIELCPQSIPRQLGCNELCPLNRKECFVSSMLPLKQVNVDFKKTYITISHLLVLWAKKLLDNLNVLNCN